MKENNEEFLEIVENKCPYCGSKDLIPSPRLKQFGYLPVTSIKTSAMGMTEQFIFGCKKCLKLSWSLKENL